MTRVLIVGSGWRFVSGISYYTCRLSNALSLKHETSALLMRRLLPRRFYPGRARVGAALSDLQYVNDVHVFDGVDWYWGASMARALSFLRRERPDVVVFQWWTGTVLHSYVMLVIAARLLKCRIVVEWHEVQDTGEIRIPGARSYVRLLLPLLLKRVDAHVVHSGFDKETLIHEHGLERTSVTVIPHGPYDHHVSSVPAQQSAVRAAGPNILFFGVIRPYKGLEDLVLAFDSLVGAGIDATLTIVGETWEGWTLPLDLVSESAHRTRITVVNRYVRDNEVPQFFADADIVALPYRRSSASGPLHIAMSAGLPVVVTNVGGLNDAAAGYAGAVLVAPESVDALVEGLRVATQLVGQRFADARSWDDTVLQFTNVFDALTNRAVRAGAGI